MIKHTNFTKLRIMIDIKKIIVLILCGLIFTESKQIYATIQMMDQVMILDAENLEISQSVNTDFMEDSQCPNLNNENDCVISSGCEWMMGECMESMLGGLDVPHFVTLDELNGYWFITAIASGFIAQYSLLDNTFIDSYFVGDAPALIAIDPINQVIYCSTVGMMFMDSMNGMMPSLESNTIQVLNYSPIGLSQSINQEYIIDSTAPHGIAINEDGTEIYTASNTADWIYKINTQNGEILGVPMDQNVNNTPDLIMQRLKPIQCLSTGNRLFISCSAGNWINPSTQEITVIEGKLQMWNSDSMELIDTIDLGEYSSPWHIVKSPLDQIIYVVLGGSDTYETEGLASVSYENDNLSINWITNNSSFDTLHGVDVSADGQKIYVSGRGDGNIHIFDYNGNYIENIFLGQMTMLGGIAVEKKDLPIIGDINNDLNINISDIINLVDMVLYPTMSHPYQVYASDFNQNELINIFDIILLVENILSN